MCEIGCCRPICRSLAGGFGTLVGTPSPTRDGGLCQGWCAWQNPGQEGGGHQQAGRGGDTCSRRGLRGGDAGACTWKLQGGSDEPSHRAGFAGGTCSLVPGEMVGGGGGTQKSPEFVYKSRVFTPTCFNVSHPQSPLGRGQRACGTPFPGRRAGSECVDLVPFVSPLPRRPDVSL